MTSKTPSERHLPKGLLLLPVAAAAATLSVIAATRRLMRRAAPAPGGRLSVAGLRAPVDIHRYEWGVPHIYAANDHDLFFAQGFTHAQDRLFQMEINRRLGQGRLAEMIGPSG